MYASGRPGVLKSVGRLSVLKSFATFASVYNDQYYQPSTYIPGQGLKSEYQIANNVAAQSTTAQAAINSGNVGAAALTGSPQGLITVQEQAFALPAAQAAALNTIAPTTAAVNLQTAGAIEQGAQTAALIGTQQAAATAADTYQKIQGGGIAAQSYTALPYIIGGVVVLGLVGWIIYTNNRQHSSRKRR